MSQQQNALDQKASSQVLHIRSDSETKLDELFNAVIHPKEYQVPLTVPMRLRNLPPSFFKQPENGSKLINNNNGVNSQALGLQINHAKAQSSPASLQAFSVNSTQHQHLRQQSYDLLDEPLPPGWELAKTSTGQRYFLNHLTQTTTWEDPRKKANVGSTTATGQTLNLQNLGALPKGWEQATTLEGEVYFINHIERTTSWLDPRIPAHLQNPPLIQTPAIHGAQGNAGQLPPPSLTLASSIATVKGLTTNSANGQVSLQQRQQQLRLQRLQMERERLRIRQQEIMRQTACLGNPLANPEILLRQSLVEEMQTSPSSELSPATLDSFLDGTTDFHSRQESADSGLGLGSNYSLPNTPEDFLTNLEDVEDCQSNDLGLDLQTSLDLGDENMDSDDLVPSLQEALNADILSDVEALLSSNKDSVLTWL